MGMFDRVWADCPECGEPVEFQSKVGNCCLDSHSSDHVPVEIANDLDGDVMMCNCGYIVTLSYPRYFKIVMMQVN